MNTKLLHAGFAPLCKYGLLLQRLAHVAFQVLLSICTTFWYMLVYVRGALE